MTKVVVVEEAHGRLWNGPEEDTSKCGRSPCAAKDRMTGNDGLREIF